MAEPTSDRDDLFAQWRKQVEAGTDAWIRTVRQMASQGHVPPPPDPMQFWRQFSNVGSTGAPPFPGAGLVDPQVLTQWKQFLDDWIAAWSRALEQAMGTEAFAEALGKTLDQFLTIQGKARQAAERSGKAAIDALGLPSREQVVGLSRQVMDLEDRLEAIEDKLDEFGSGPPAAPAAADPSGRRQPARGTTGGGATKTGGGAKTRSRTAKAGGDTKTGAGSAEAGAAKIRSGAAKSAGTGKTRGGGAESAGAAPDRQRRTTRAPKRRA